LIVDIFGSKHIEKKSLFLSQSHIRYRNLHHGLGTCCKGSSTTPLSLEVTCDSLPLFSPILTIRSKLLPLVILFIAIAGFAFVGYHLYLTVQRISATTTEKMQKKNVVFTKDGLKVGVKEVKNESYVDSTQSLLVKAWNLSSWPAYKSSLGWNKDAEINQRGKAGSRKP
jgi:hypothetical protein